MSLANSVAIVAKTIQHSISSTFLSQSMLRCVHSCS